MKFKDEKTWRETVEINKPSADDPGYGEAILKYAEAWADAMETTMLATGKTVAEVAKDCEPKDHGITGFMYGAAVGILAVVWEHGEALRKWHNGNFKRPDAEGIVNPAIITIG